MIREVAVPAEMKESPLQVIKVFLKGLPVVKDQPTQMSSGNILLPASRADIVRNEGELKVFGLEGTIDVGEWPYFATRDWTSEPDYLEWEFNLLEPGYFEVQVINVSTTRSLASHKKIWNARFGGYKDFHRVSLTVNGKSVTGNIDAEEPLHSIRSAHRPEFINRIGIMEIDEPGTYTAMLEAEFINPRDPDGVAIYEVRLQKVSRP